MAAIAVVGAALSRDRLGQVAQLVEQRTENPRVGGSIPPLATILFNGLRRFQGFLKKPLREFCVTQLTLSRRKTTNSGLLPLLSHTLFAASMSFESSAAE